MRARISWPMGSRGIQRNRLCTTSVARTGSPSWNFSPSRRRKVQILNSASCSSPSTICRFGASLLSTP